MKSLRAQRLVYSLALEVSTDLALISAYLLGAEKWVFFGVLFLLGKVFGVWLTMYYWNLQDKTIKAGMAETKKGRAPSTR